MFRPVFTPIHILFWIFSYVVGNAEEIHIQPASSLGEKPLAKAVANAAAGDVLVIEPGIYSENISVAKTLTIRGLPGAVLDGSKLFQGAWVKAGKDLPGVYRTPSKKRPRGLLVDGKFIAEIRFDRVQETGAWHWKTLLSKGSPRSGFDEIRALWMYHPEKQEIYARFEGNTQPGDLELSILPDRKALIHVDGAKNVTIEGLTFAHGSTGLLVDNGASHCVVRKCKITSFESSGIVLTGGASGCLVENCDITRGSYEEWMPSLEHNRANYEIWQIHKNAGNYDRNAIVIIRSGTNNRIIGNHLHRVFDGVSLGDYKAESLDIPLPDPNHGRGTEIANNIIANTRDSGIELGIGCVDVHVHHNILRRTHGGLRFKLPRIGPIYIYRNRLIDGAPFNLWFSMDASPAEAFVYHNTVVGGRSEFLQIGFPATKRDFIAPKWHFLNNLTLNKNGFCKPEKKASLDFFAACNINVGAARPWPGDNSKDKASLYKRNIPHNKVGKPARGSIAINSGLDLSIYLNGKPLPGCGSGYFIGKAPDAGADEVE